MICLKGYNENEHDYASESRSSSRGHEQYSRNTLRQYEPMHEHGYTTDTYDEFENRSSSRQQQDRYDYCPVTLFPFSRNASWNHCSLHSTLHFVTVEVPQSLTACRRVAFLKHGWEEALHWKHGFESAINRVLSEFLKAWLAWGSLSRDRRNMCF